MPGPRFPRLVAWAAASLAISASAGCFEIVGEERKDTTREEVEKLSTFNFIPASARHINYQQGPTLQDSQDIVYFQAPRQDVDAFTMRLLGFVPSEPADGPNRSLEVEGWPQPPSQGGRAGKRDESEVGIRKVVIVDHAQYSEVWVEVWNWCPDCKSADLTGKPPSERRSTIQYGSEMPPLLPPPPRE